MTPAKPPLDVETALQQLERAHGPHYWRTLDELAQTDAFRALLRQKLPSALSILEEGIDRRRFLGLLGASLALAGIGGCAQAPIEHINPYVRAPEELIPGRPLYFATAMPLAGCASGGLLVESHMGRPTKVEGDPGHPASPASAISPRRAEFGPSDVFAQASILSLYDADRSASPQHLGEIATWEAFRSALHGALQRRPSRELRLRILTGTVTSPTIADVMGRVLARFPQARWHQWEPAGQWNALEGARLAFGQPVETQYRLDRADRIVSLDCDFLACRQSPLVYARDFGDRRRVWNQGAAPQMNRLHVVESMPTVTGAKADHRVPLRSAQMESFARALASRVGIAAGPAVADSALGLPAGWLDELANDLQRHQGRSAILAGNGQPPIVHALSQAINERLGNFWRTVWHTRPIAVAAPHDAMAARHDHVASIQELVEEMNAGRVDLLLLLGGNPVYTAPADLAFADALAQMHRHQGLLVHLSPFFDETSAHCHWHLNEAHFLESWGDVRAHDGTVSIIQPLIAPLYQGRASAEVLALLAGPSAATGLDLLQGHWRRVFAGAAEVGDERRGYADFRPAGDFETWWRRCVHDGRISGTQAPNLTDLRVSADFTHSAAGSIQGLEINFRPDPSVFDGSFANNGWLQELPRPISGVTWDNVAYLSPATAARLNLVNGAEVTLRLQGREVQAPVWLLPGHADESITVTLGYGRRRAGRVGTGVGFDAYRLRTAAAPWFAAGLAVTPTGRRITIAATQGHHAMENGIPVLGERDEAAEARNLIRSDPLSRLGQRAAEGRAQRARQTISLYPPRDYTENKWGMAIDLNACTGCQACVIACQSENNIPVVGKDQVLRGREMHWLRVDSYYKGQPVEPLKLETLFQPVPCMHCENAPCELVCPVEATVHSDEGLNDMVYNRCVGTRYCSNNCPYKVRRFNFLQYSDFADEHQRLKHNPDVTVRSRGVMEKCTYCVQRIRAAQIVARRDGPQGRPLVDGEIQTACQSACPVGAIAFGDLNLAGSRVKQMQDHDLNYALLADLNTRPRTTYLSAFKNLNPVLAGLEGRGEVGGHPSTR